MAQGTEVNCATGAIVFVDVAPPTAEELRLGIPSVTPRQARLALLQAELLDAAQDALDAIPSPQREAALIEWEYASEIQRTSSLIAAIGAALSLSEEQIDDLFRTASAL